MRVVPIVFLVAIPVGIGRYAELEIASRSAMKSCDGAMRRSQIWRIKPKNYDYVETRALRAKFGEQKCWMLCSF